MKFYILDTRSCVGNCAMWWCTDGKGYTCNLDEAGLYDESFTGRPTDQPVPEAEARVLVRSHVSWDGLSKYLKRARDEQTRLNKLSRPKCTELTAKHERCKNNANRDGSLHGSLCHVHARQARRLEYRREEIRREEILRFDVHDDRGPRWW